MGEDWPGFHECFREDPCRAHPRVIDEKIGAQRGKEACPWSHSQSGPAGGPAWAGSLHVSLLELDFQHQGALAFRVQSTDAVGHGPDPQMAGLFQKSPRWSVGRAIVKIT